MPVCVGAIRGRVPVSVAKLVGVRQEADLNDVKYDAFLANDRTLGDPEVVKVEPGGRVLLRIINSSSMSAFHIELGALDGELIAVDGFCAGHGQALPRRSGGSAAGYSPSRAIASVTSSYPGTGGARGRQQTNPGIVLRAGNAAVARIADTAAMASSALTLDLERRLRAIAPLEPRKADRRHTLNLTGNMASYIWSLNNVAWTKETPPLPIAQGERVELLFVNQTLPRLLR